MILVTGGAGFIGSNFVLDWLAAAGEPVVNLDKLTYAGNLGNLAVASRRRAARVRARRHRRSRARRGAARRSIGRARSSTSPPRATSTARSTARPRSSRPTSSARSRCSRRARACWATLPDAASARRSASCTSRPTRSTARSAPDDPAFSRDHAVRAEQPVLGVEGGVRSPGARLPPHLRPADADDQLLEQLRPAPVSREADPADDRQRARGQAAAGLRRRPATCATGSTSAITARRSARCSQRGRPGETYNVGGNAEMTNLDVVHTLCRIARRERGPGATTRTLITFVTDRPGHDRRYAIDAAKIRARARLDAVGDIRARPAPHRATGTSTNGEWLRSVESGEYRQWVDAALRRAEVTGVTAAKASSSPAARARGCIR